MTHSAGKAERPAFTAHQYAFTAHIRDPERHPRPPGVEARRMNIYVELFYNNVEDFMASSYPVLRSITPDDRWHAMIRDYFARHRATTPLFPEMPREFLHYLEHERAPDPEDPPFLLELAHYEWVELALAMADDEPVPPGVDRGGDLLSGRPVLSPLAWPLAYRYPVHRIGPDFQPAEEGTAPTFLLVYRDAGDEVHFLEINPVTARLLELIQAGEDPSGEAMLRRIAREMEHPDPGIVIRGGAETLRDLHRRGAVAGVRAAGG